jgi:kynureninase
VLQVAAVEEGVRLVAEAGTAAIRAKSELLTDLAERLHDERLGRHGCTFASPRDPSRRGAHVAVRHPAAAACTLALRARGVVPDLRPPDVVRVGLSPLTTRFVDVWDGLAALDDVLAAGAWRPYEGVAPAVT